MDAEQAEHSFALLRMLKELRKNCFICDVDLKVGEQLVPAHKAVLAASSDYFVDYFSVPRFGPVQIPGVSPDALRFCLDYMYEGVANLNFDLVEEVLEASKQLRLHGLVRKCVKFLSFGVTISGCLEVARIAERLDLMPLRHIAEAFSVQHHKLVVRSVSFRNLEFTGVSTYLRKLESPEDMWEAALYWVKSDFGSRKWVFTRYLEIILPLGTFEFIFNTVRNERPILDIPECSTLVTRALFQTVDHSKLTVSNSFLLLETAFSYRSECPDAKRKIIREFIAANFDSATETGGFRNLRGEDLLEILKSPNSKIFSAEQIWKSVVVWVKSDLRCRKKFLRKIMQSIQWKRCSFRFILDSVFNDFLVKNSKACSALAAEYLLKFMKDTDITQSNWFVLLEIRKEHDGVLSNDSIEKIITFAAMNFAQISVTDCFGQVSFDVLIRLLVNDEVRKSCTDDVIWQSAMKWIKTDVDERRMLLPELLNCLSLKTWNFRFLYDTVLNELLVRESAECEKDVASTLLSILSSSDISISNCYELIKLSNKFRIEKSDSVTSKIHRFLVDNYSDVEKHDYFVHLDWETIEFILKNEKFQEHPTELKWFPMVKWINGGSNRERFLPEIVENLQLNIFPFVFLEKKVFHHELIQSNEGCKSQCAAAMFRNMTYCDINHVNWFDLLSMLKTHTPENGDELLQKVKQFMAANFTQISQSAHFHELTIDEVLTLLNSPEIASATAGDQMRGVLKWKQENESATEDDLIAMVHALRLEGFPFNLLFNTLMNEESITNSPRCVELFLCGIQHGIVPCNVSLENWLNLIETVKRNESGKFLKIIHVVLNFVASKFTILQRYILDFELDDLDFVLRSSALTCSEREKASLIMSWVAKQESSRWMYLSDLLGLIKFKELDRKFIKSGIYENPMVKSSDTCREILLECLMQDNSQESVNLRSRKRDRNFVSGTNGNSL